MPYVRVLLFASVILAGCAAPAQRAEQGAQDQKALGQRIEQICALSEPGRSAEIEKLKNESGMVLYCGK